VTGPEPPATTPPAPAPGGVFRARTEVMSASDVRRALTRIAHEIIERNEGLDRVMIVGIQQGGVELANAVADALEQIEGARPPCGSLDVTFYRDDIAIRSVVPHAVSNIPADLSGATVVLVDDVLYTGRTVRSALDALNDYGRPKAVQLAVVVDRGHRELPIRPDFVGKNLPTAKAEVVHASLEGVVIGEYR
jgi:pyrimidine operon attenuation protein/uracil phosphoribosyltransferase